MTYDLFREVVEGGGSTPDSRYSALPVSIVAHAILLTVLVVIPLMASDVLPLVRTSDYLVMPVVAVPRPPSIPAPAAPRAPAVAELASASAAPVNAPSGIGREQMIQVERVPDSAAPSEAVGSVLGTGVPGGTGIGEIEAPPPRAAAPVYAYKLPKPPIKIRDVSPVYPTIAEVGRVQGIVIIEAIIGVTGEVTDAKVLSGKPILNEAALDAVRQWRYTPTLLGGVPTPVILVVTVTFSLS